MCTLSLLPLQTQPLSLIPSLPLLLFLSLHTQIQLLINQQHTQQVQTTNSNSNSNTTYHIEQMKWMQTSSFHYHLSPRTQLLPLHSWRPWQARCMEWRGWRRRTSGLRLVPLNPNIPQERHSQRSQITSKYPLLTPLLSPLLSASSSIFILLTLNNIGGLAGIRAYINCKEREEEVLDELLQYQSTFLPYSN